MVAAVGGGWPIDVLVQISDLDPRTSGNVTLPTETDEDPVLVEPARLTDIMDTKIHY